MKYELSHDVLALKAYERASADDKTLRKVERLVKERYAFYRQRQTLLSKDDLDYIKPYLAQITINEGEREFIEKSDRAVKRRNRILAGIIIAIFLALSSLTLFAWFQNRNAQTEKENAIKARELADENAIRAQQKEQEAQTQRDSALFARNLAAENARLAQEREFEAQIQRDNALAARNEADESARIAQEKEQEAQTEKDRAVKAREEADQNALLADRNASRADSLRILSLAQSLMAIAAQTEDPVLKAKLANQAYNFHIQQKGDPYDPIIHDGLRSALMAVNWENAIKKHQSAITGMAFTLDGKHLFSTARDGKLLKWNWDSRLDSVNAVTLSNPLITQGGLSMSEEWLTVSGNQTNGLQVFKIADFPKPFSHTFSIEQPIHDLIFIPSNKHQLVLATSMGLTSIDFQATRSNKAPFAFSEKPTLTLAIHPSGKWVAGITEEGKVEMGQTSGEVISFPTDKTADINAIAFSQDGKFFTAGDKNGKVWLYDFDTKELLANLSGHSARVSQVSFYQKAAQTFLVSVGYDGKAQLWQWKGKENEQVKVQLSTRLPIILRAEEKWEFSLAFSPDGKRILIGNRNGEIQQWLINLSDMNIQLRQLVPNLRFSQDEWKQYFKDEPFQ